jgi:hypothetical protein
MQRITQIAVDQMLGNNRLIGRLMILFNRSSFAISRWITSRDKKLTTPLVLEVIREETGLTDDQILEEITPEKSAA